MKDNQRAFVDTNILVYAFDYSAGDKHIAANQLLKTLWETRLGCLSTQVLQEFFVTVTRKIRLPLSAAKTVEIIDDLGAWDVHTISVSDIITAIEIQQRYQISFWDALIICAAQQQQCAILWTEDLNHGQAYDSIVVRNPFA